MVDFKRLTGVMEDMKARMNINQEKREAILEWMKTKVDAKQDEMKACQEMTEACLKKMKANQEKTLAKIGAYLEKREANQEKLEEVDEEKTEDVTEHYKGAPRYRLLTALHGQASDALHGDPKAVFLNSQATAWYQVLVL